MGVQRRRHAKLENSLRHDLGADKNPILISRYPGRSVWLATVSPTNKELRRYHETDVSDSRPARKEELTSPEDSDVPD